MRRQRHRVGSTPKTLETISRERERVCVRVNIKPTKVRTTAEGGQE